MKGEKMIGKQWILDGDEEVSKYSYHCGVKCINSKYVELLEYKFHILHSENVSLKEEVDYYQQEDTELDM